MCQVLHRCRLDDERLKNKQLADQLKVYQQKSGFNNQVQNEQLKDANSECLYNQ